MSPDQQIALIDEALNPTDPSETDGEQVGDDTFAMLDPARKTPRKFTRPGWIEAAPGYWVKPECSPTAIAAKARAAAHVELDDFLADPEGYTGAES